MNDEARRTMRAITSASLSPSWRHQMVPSLVSAVTSGVVAWLVCLYCVRDSDAPVAHLEVGSLIVTDRLTVRNAGNDGDAMLVKDGSLFVKNRVVATQFLGAQLASSVIVANRQLTTPDDLFKVPADQWKFYTETGSSNDEGGELVVRSRGGGTSVAKQSVDGTTIRIGFDLSESTHLTTHNAKSNVTQSLLGPRRRSDTVGADGETAVASRTGRNETSTIPPPIVAETAPQIASQFTPTPETPLPLPALSPVPTQNNPQPLPALSPPFQTPPPPPQFTAPSHWE